MARRLFTEQELRATYLARRNASWPASFEEAMRLYPPAPSINRAPIEDDTWTAADGTGERLELRVGR